MANPYVNKVVTSDGRTLIDLTGDTITASDAVVGVTLHLKDGRQVTGTLADFSGGAHGLVPASSSSTQGNYLRGDGTWGITPKTKTLTTAGWSNGTQTVTVSGVTASNTVIVSPAPASADVYAAAGVRCTAQAANSLTFSCASTPTEALTVNVMIM